MRAVSAREARAAIAAHVLGPGASGRVGAVRLHAHQRDAVARLRRMIAESGGALLADDVGLGKTFVALAVVAAERDVLVVAPAAVRDHWHASASRAGVPLTFCSMEALSRGKRPPGLVRFVVVDEAHHFREPRTRRFAAVAELCRTARVLLMSATPVQNRAADLRVILSLFLGRRAHALRDQDLRRHVLRRSGDEITIAATATLPGVQAPEWLEPVDDVDCLDRILALPPPVPPWDGDDGGVLVTWSLVRQWSSSRAALHGALRRRLGRGLAMGDALRAGRLPTRAELAGWCYADGAQQLFLAGLLDSGSSASPALLGRVELHVSAVRALLAWLSGTRDPDEARAQRLRDLRGRVHGERIIAFSEYSETVAALYRALLPDGGVAMVTHRGGRIASGAVSRAELLRQFAPGAGTRTPRQGRVDLLLSTDVLSEGINLPDAGIVVHLDLSWNPARLEQRVGRLRRLDSTRDFIGVFLMPPPAPAERMLDLERRLRVKRAIAGRSVGIAGSILPGPPGNEDAPADGGRERRITQRLAAWGGNVAPGEPVVAAVAAACEGALACVRVDGAVELVAIIGGHVTADRAAVEAACQLADGEGIAAEAGAAERVAGVVQRWLDDRATTGVMDVGVLHLARARRTLLRRVDEIARRAPFHARPALGALIRSARTVATATLAGGAERVLEELAAAPMPDAAWLHAVSEFGALNTRTRREPAALLGLILLAPRP